MPYMHHAIQQARKSLAEGGIPIGAALVLDNELISLGHNRRVQNGSAILHAEMDCLENAGRLTPEEYKRCTLYTTLTPCWMCTGAILLYKIPTVVIGDIRTYRSPALRLLMGSAIVEINESTSVECQYLLGIFINENPTLWNEDIGVSDICPISVL